MTEEPELGVRYDALGVHGIGRLEYEIRDGEVRLQRSRARYGSR